MQDGGVVKLPQRYLDFWTGPDVSETQLARFRLVFFALIAVDAFLFLAHAPRYGAGGFNVAQFPALSFLTPELSRVAVIVCSIVMSYLAARIALGIGTRWLTACLAVIYAIVYLSSQLDSFQHHFLLVLVLASLATIDWSDSSKRGPAVRLIMLQVSVVYVFAAVSKMEATWWDGNTLEAAFAQLDPSVAVDVVKKLGYGNAARLIVLIELAVAVAIHFRATRLPTALVGIGLHVGIQLAGFKIELFSYYMLAIYLLVLPPSAFRWSKLRLPSVPTLRIPHAAVVAAAMVAGAVAISLLPLAGSFIAAGLIALFAITRRLSEALAHVAAIGLVVALGFGSDAIRDHYRFWGGSLKRLGDQEGATIAYEKLTQVDPDYAPGRRNLGKLYLAAGRTDDALAEYRAADAAAPKQGASQLGLATVYARLGNSEDAIYHAKRAIEIAEANAQSPKETKQIVREANAILQRVGGAL